MDAREVRGPIPHATAASVASPTIEELRAEIRKLHEWRRAVLSLLFDQEADRFRRLTLINAGNELAEYGFHERPTLPDRTLPDDDEPGQSDVVIVETT